MKVKKITKRVLIIGLILIATSTTVFGAEDDVKGPCISATISERKAEIGN